MRSLFILLALPLAAYVALCALMYFGQRSHVYYPVPESGAANARSIQVENGDVRLKVWAVPRPGARALIYFGGNAEDVAANLDGFKTEFPAHSLYLVNYRGYGGSGGSPSETALQSDAIAIYDQLRPRHAQISVMGRSLGAAVAMTLASEREVERLVLVTPFDSLVNVARSHYRWLPVGLLMRDRYDSAARVPAVRAPTLVVIATGDELIPRARTDALTTAFPPAQLQIVLLEGARHNDIDLNPQYLDSIGKFLAR